MYEGYDILLEDRDGLSPFHYALRCGRLDVLQFLSAVYDNALSNLWYSLAHHGNYHSRDKQYRKHLQCILEKDAEPFPMIEHTGGIVGSIVSCQSKLKQYGIVCANGSISPRGVNCIKSKLIDSRRTKECSKQWAC